MAQITRKTTIAARQSARHRFDYEVSANGVTGRVTLSAPSTVTAEPIAINGKTGVVFRDAHGDPIKYVLH